MTTKTLTELEEERRLLTSQVDAIQTCLQNMKYGKVKEEAERLMKGFEGSVFPFSTIDPRGIHNKDYHGKIRFFRSQKEKEQDTKAGSLECSGPSGRLIISLLEIIANLREASEPEPVMTGGFQPCSICGSKSLRCGCD